MTSKRGLLPIDQGFSRVPFFDVVIDERMREIIWGMGVFPFWRCGSAARRYTLVRRSLTLGVLLTAGGRCRQCSSLLR